MTSDFLFSWVFFKSVRGTAFPFFLVFGVDFFFCHIDKITPPEEDGILFTIMSPERLGVV